MEVSHAHFSEVTGMVFVDIRSMVMLPARHTTSTRMLSVLANAAVTSGDMAAADRKNMLTVAADKCLRTVEVDIGIRLTVCGFGSDA